MAFRTRVNSSKKKKNADPALLSHYHTWACSINVKYNMFF